MGLVFGGQNSASLPLPPPPAAEQELPPPPPIEAAESTPPKPEKTARERREQKRRNKTITEWMEDQSAKKQRWMENRKKRDQWDDEDDASQADSKKMLKARNCRAIIITRKLARNSTQFSDTLPPSAAALQGRDGDRLAPAGVQADDHEEGSEYEATLCQ